MGNSSAGDDAVSGTNFNADLEGDNVVHGVAVAFVAVRSDKSGNHSPVRSLSPVRSAAAPSAGGR